jgi:hypothetical protein
LISPFLERLDEIERRDYEPGVDAEALDIMKVFAQSPVELSILVERYSGSTSVNIASYLAFFLAEMAEEVPTSELYRQLFIFIQRCRFMYEARILGSCSRTLLMLLMHECVWQEHSNPPTMLYPFLQRALDYSYPIKYATYVQRSAIQVISYLYETNLLQVALNRWQLTWIRDKLLNLSGLRLDELESELTWLPEFTAKGDLFFDSPLLTRLEELKKSTIEGIGGVDNELLALMEDFAHGIDELWILIERYGSSTSRTLVVTLTSLVGKVTESLQWDTLQIVLSVIAKIRGRGEPIAFANCLLSIRQLILSDRGWPANTQPPLILLPFLQHCLTYPNPLPQYKALQLIELLCGKDLLRIGVASSQLAVLYECVIQASRDIRKESWEPFGGKLPDLPSLAQCLSNTQN